MTAHAAKAGAIDNNGARKNKKLLDFDGKTISLNINLRASAMGWSKPK
jgi:hypothetical protein